MREVGVLEAKTQLSALLAEIEKTGEPVVITRHGRPIAKIVPPTGAVDAREATPEKPARPRKRWTEEEIEAFFRWRDEVHREAIERGAEPFDWKEAAREGRE
jgi:prevent-host-death family protein